MGDQYFKIDIRSNRPGGDIKIIDLSGELDVTTLTSIREIFSDLFDNKYYQIVMNCENVKYIDSTIFGLIVNKLKVARHNFGDIKLSGLNTQLIRIFKVLGGLKIFNIYDDETSALEAYK